MARTVLVPFDGSDPSRSALGYAQALAREERVVALDVVEPLAPTSASNGERGPYERAFERTRDRLADAEAVAAEAGGAVDTEFHYGHPVHEILRYVDRYVVEEVVMGAHGRDGAEDLLLGSVAESVVRRSPVPVTVVRPTGAAGEGALPASVLVPFDGSTPARDALSYALERFPDADVTALFADYPGAGDVEHLGPGGDRSTGFEAWYEGVREWHRQADRDPDSVLGFAADVGDAHDRAVEATSEPGDPTRVVVEYARQHGVDHVVVGSHGHENVMRHLLGSVAAFVVRRAPVSVTAVR